MRMRGSSFCASSRQSSVASVDAVVDEYEVEGDALPVSYLGVAIDRLEEGRDGIFLVVDRHDQRNGRDAHVGTRLCAG